MDYRTHLNSAIECLEQRIELLKAQGWRMGHVLPNPTSKNTIQYHWVSDGKKKYIKKYLLLTYRQECQRGKRISELQGKIEVLQSL